MLEYFGHRARVQPAVVCQRSIFSHPASKPHSHPRTPPPTPQTPLPPPNHKMFGIGKSWPCEALPDTPPLAHTYTFFRTCTPAPTPPPPTPLFQPTGKKGGQKFDTKDKQTHLVAKPAAAAEPPKPKKKSAAELAAEDVDEEEELDEAEASVFKIALAATLVYVTIGVVSFYFIYKPVGWGFCEFYAPLFVLRS